MQAKTLSLLLILLLTCCSHRFDFQKYDPPVFTGSSAKEQRDNEWLIVMQGDELECKFEHDPLVFKKEKNGTLNVLINSKNMTMEELKRLKLTFNQVMVVNNDNNDTKTIETPLKNKILIEQPIESQFVKIQTNDRPSIEYRLQGSIKINTLELSKNKLYACCLENANSNVPSCAILRLSGSPASLAETTNDDTSIFTYYTVLYKVIIVLLIVISILLLSMLFLCVHFTNVEANFWNPSSLFWCTTRQQQQRRQQRRRSPHTSIRSLSSPQLFTVSVPGQASMPKLNLVSRGDLYDRYNINANVTVVDETDDNTMRTNGGELAPPPPYTEFVADINSNRH